MNNRLSPVHVTVRVGIGVFLIILVLVGHLNLKCFHE